MGLRNKGPYDIDATWAKSDVVDGIELMWVGGPKCPIFVFSSKNVKHLY